MPTSILCLCPELMAHIFGYLEVADKQQAAQVCLSWWAAAYQPCLWRGVAAQLPLHPDPVLYQSLVTRNIRQISCHFEETLYTTVQSLPELQALHYNGLYQYGEGPLEEVFILAFDREFHHLTWLSLEYCIYFTTDHMMELLSKNCRQLVTLKLDYCRELNEVGIVSLSCLTKLKFLQMDMCRVKIDPLCAQLQLEHLTFKYSGKMTDDTLRLISVSWLNLKGIDLTGCGFVTDIGLEYLSKLVNLRCIMMNDYCKFSDAGMSILAGMPSLRRLSLNYSQISDAGLMNLVDGGSQIRELSLRECAGVTNVGLELLCHMSSLKTVDLRECAEHVCSDVVLTLLRQNGVTVITDSEPLPDGSKLIFSKSI